MPPHLGQYIKYDLRQFIKLTSSKTLTPQRNHLSASLCPHQNWSSWAGTVPSHSVPPAVLGGEVGRTALQNGFCLPLGSSQPADSHPWEAGMMEAGPAKGRVDLPAQPWSGRGSNSLAAPNSSPGCCDIPSSCLGRGHWRASDGLVHSTALWWPPRA